MPRRVKVYEINEVRLMLQKSNPPQLLIEVDATAPTPNYTEPELVEYVYIQPPSDGVYEFDFVATPPTGPATQVLSPISAKYVMAPMPDGLKGVKVYASNNSKVQMLALANAGDICIRGTLTDEGVECQALRADDGELYTLVGDLNGHQNGDAVVVCGTVAGISFCMQGTTINVSWIGKEAQKAVPATASTGA